MVLVPLGFLLVIGTLSLQTAVVTRFRLWGVHADLLTILALSAGLFGGPWRGAAMGFAGGFLGDVVSGQLIGLDALGKGLAGYLAGLAGKRMFRDKPLVVAGVTFVGTVVEQILFILGAKAFGIPFALGRGIVQIGIPLGILNALIAVSVGWPLIRFLRRYFLIQSRGTVRDY